MRVEIIMFQLVLLVMKVLVSGKHTVPIRWLMIRGAVLRLRPTVDEGRMASITNVGRAQGKLSANKFLTQGCYMGRLQPLLAQN